MYTLSSLLEKEGFSVVCSSDKKNKLIRLIDMCFSVIKYRNKADYILIDTFSTLNFYYAFVVSQIARLFKIKYLPILHGGNLPARIEKSKLLSRLIFNNSHKNIAPSYYLKNAFEAKEYTVEHIPNVLEIEKYTFKKRTNLEVKLLWVRAFKHLYNPMLAIDVVLLLKDKYPKVKLCMIGPAKDDSFQKVTQRVADEKLEDIVEFTGVLTPKDWHKKSEDYDIMINTTNFDNTPVSIMEGMALGLQIVSTNVGGIPYLIENGKDGVLVEKDNATLMAKSIEDIITNNSQEMMSNARKKAESFGWEFVRKKWAKIFI
jgi:glycosyltransferase involved in cell wall biosynthesis